MRRPVPQSSHPFQVYRHLPDLGIPPKSLYFCHIFYSQEALACRIPNPLAAARQRMKLLCPSLDASFLGGGPLGRVEEASCVGAPEGGPKEPRLVLYVAKFLAADMQNLRLTGDTLMGKQQSPL